MNDDILEVTTAYADIAELGQGYIDRVDGERILLAFSHAVQSGAAVRFIIYLVDGTPAFAGAGRCVQVSDQGTDVAPTERYETLLDSLTFDERSAPVYEYIVAVRQVQYPDAAFAKPEPEAVTAENPYVSEDTARYSEAVTVLSEDPAHAERLSRESLASVSDVEPLPESLRAPEPAASGSGSALTPLPAALLTPSSIPASATPEAAEVAQQPLPRSSRPPPLPSVQPEPLPTGILTRPACVAHWVPAPVRPPQRSLRPRLFATEAGPLKVPAAPPRPVLDRSQWIERAPAP
ncbi:MAG: hypothetical protein ABW321_16825 [Polyangiales bacterium]